jgi:DNA-binding beta-propeller fold protein YncE
MPCERRKNTIIKPFLIYLAVGFVAAGVSQIEAAELNLIGRYSSGVSNTSASEIVAHDPKTQRLFVVNGSSQNRIDVLNIANPTAPTLAFSIDISPFGSHANSVAVDKGLVAVAVEANVLTDLGKVVFFDADGNYLNAVTAGSLPDMVTFTPNGRKVVVANEGEPNANYSVNPEGSVTIIDISRGIKKVTQADVVTAGFTQFNGLALGPDIRIGTNDVTNARTSSLNTLPFPKTFRPLGSRCRKTTLWACSI